MKVTENLIIISNYLASFLSVLMLQIVALFPRFLLFYPFKKSTISQPPMLNASLLLIICGVRNASTSFRSVRKTSRELDIFTMPYSPGRITRCNLISILIKVKFVTAKSNVCIVWTPFLYKENRMCKMRRQVPTVDSCNLWNGTFS